MLPKSDEEMWTPFLGQKLTTLALPDFHSNYFAYGFDWKKNPNLGLRITGAFGYARYMSYNIYPELGGDSLAALRDVEIEAQPDNINPFVAGNDPNVPNREYTVNVFCLDNASASTKVSRNRLTFRSAQIKAALVVILRYYLPTDPRSDKAGVPLPNIVAFDTLSNLPILSLPQNLVPKEMPTCLYEEQMLPIFETAIDNTLRFYHVTGSGEFNNKDNLYLMCGVKKRTDEVLLLKFQAPVYGTNNREYPDADVRYWSFNEGNVDTSTPWGMPDQKFKMATDGLTYIAIGSEKIKDWANQGGYNFMPWRATSPRAVVLYRNLVTHLNFEGSIHRVAKLDNLQDDPIKNRADPRIYNLDAKNYIHSYAPTGMKVTEDAFLKNYGGMPSPGFKVPG